MAQVFISCISWFPVCLSLAVFYWHQSVVVLCFPFYFEGSPVQFLCVLTLPALLFWFPLITLMFCTCPPFACPASCIPVLVLPSVLVSFFLLQFMVL